MANNAPDISFANIKTILRQCGIVTQLYEKPFDVGSSIKLFVEFDTIEAKQRAVSQSIRYAERIHSSAEIIPFEDDQVQSALLGTPYSA